jgi:hypothetical protein
MNSQKLAREATIQKISMFSTKPIDPDAHPSMAIAPLSQGIPEGAKVYGIRKIRKRKRLTKPKTFGFLSTRKTSSYRPFTSL